VKTNRQPILYGSKFQRATNKTKGFAMDWKDSRKRKIPQIAKV